MRRFQHLCQLLSAAPICLSTSFLFFWCFGFSLKVNQPFCPLFLGVAGFPFNNLKATNQEKMLFSSLGNPRGICAHGENSRGRPPVRQAGAILSGRDLRLVRALLYQSAGWGGTRGLGKTIKVAQNSLLFIPEVGCFVSVDFVS